MEEIDQILQSAIGGPDKPKKKEESSSEDEPDKEPSAAILFWAIGIIAVLIIAIFAIRAIPSIGKNENVVTYNHFDFENKEGLWWTLWERDGLQFILSLRYNPYQTLNVTTQGKISRSFERETVYITFDPTAERQTYVALAAAELSLNLARALGVEVIPACTLNETEACQSRPIVTCNSKNISVMRIQETDAEARILLDRECITFQGKEIELVRAVDRAVYTFYGIIPSFDTRE